MAFVFLSHSHQDKPFCRQLAADLRRAGHAVWIDEAEINIGDSLIDKIAAGLGQVDFVAAVLSVSSVQSAWVAKELEIASNREIDERRVVVLPLLLHDVEMPPFLRGKMYGDFRQEDRYADSLAQLLRALGPAAPVAAPTTEEVEELRAELEFVRALAAQNNASARRAGEAAFRAKSDELRKAIEAANERFPDHAPINRTYAFQIGDVVVTLDYALWAIGKSMRKGYHPLAALLAIEGRWSDLEAMLEAYHEMA